jgi:hypothetical protein
VSDVLYKKFVLWSEADCTMEKFFQKEQSEGAQLALLLFLIEEVNYQLFHEALSL